MASLKAREMVSTSAYAIGQVKVYGAEKYLLVSIRLALIAALDPFLPHSSVEMGKMAIYQLITLS